MASTYFNKGKYQILNDYISGKTFRAMFMAPSYTVDIDSHHFVDDISASRASGSADQTLTGVSITEDDTNDRAIFDADNITVDPETISGGTNQIVIYEWTGDTATSPLLTKLDIDEGTITPINGELAITFDANGLFGF